MPRDVEKSELERGRSPDRAREIAARTVNKERRDEGRTENTRPQGTGNPNRPLEERTRDEIYNLAKGLEIPGRSEMSRSELIDALRRR